MQITQKVEIVSASDLETKKLGILLAQEIISPPLQGGARGGKKLRTATVISLEGDLGAGKTTFAQGFAEGLGIKEKIKSPTYVILKIYKIKKIDFIHIDAYRVGSKDFAVLGWKDFVKDPKTIICIEWGDRIKKILPKNTLRILFSHQKGDKRKIKILQ